MAEESLESLRKEIKALKARRTRLRDIRDVKMQVLASKIQLAPEKFKNKHYILNWLASKGFHIGKEVTGNVGKGTMKAAKATGRVLSKGGSFKESGCEVKRKGGEQVSWNDREQRLDAWRELQAEARYEMEITNSIGFRDNSWWRPKGGRPKNEFVRSMADRYNVSRRTILRWMRAGTLSINGR